MNRLIKNIPLQWDLWAGEYRAYFPTYEDDLAACRALMPALAHLDMPSLPAACVDSRKGKTAAGIQLMDGTTAQQQSYFKDLIPFDLFDEEQLSKLVVFLGFSIAEGYDKSPAPLVLLSHCFVEVLRAGAHGVLMSCDPEHFSIYKRLGLRPVGQVQERPNGSYRIPMIGLPDHDYLSIIHSPVLPMLLSIDFGTYTGLCNWYYQLVREDSSLRVSSAFYAEDERDFEGHNSITDGLSDEGKQAFLKRAMVINSKEGEVLITEHDGGKAFGYIRRGLVKVVIGGKTVVLLGQGDIFGEIAFILGTKRTAQVISASRNTEVVLFNEEAINSLANDKDKTIIWQNLAKVLAQRIVLTNQLLSDDAK